MRQADVYNGTVEDPFLEENDGLKLQIYDGNLTGYRVWRRNLDNSVVYEQMSESEIIFYGEGGIVQKEKFLKQEHFLIEQCFTAIGEKWSWIVPKFDFNMDYHIDILEMRAFVERNLGSEPDQEAIWEFLSSYDINKDEKLSVKELKNALN